MFIDFRNLWGSGEGNPFSVSQAQAPQSVAPGFQVAVGGQASPSPSDSSSADTPYTAPAIMQGATMNTVQGQVTFDQDNPAEAVDIRESWGSFERSDGATVTVGKGLVRQDSTVYRGIVVQVEGADGGTQTQVLDPSKTHRLTKNAEGGYDLAEGLVGGDGDDLFVGADLSGLSLEGGGGENAVFTQQAANLTYAGGSGRDAILANVIKNSRINLGQGDDILDGGSVSNSTVNLGDGDDFSSARLNSSTLIGGQGDDEVHGELYEATVNLGDGDDSLEGYHLEQSKIALGGGNDSLNFYELIDSEVDGSASDLGLAQAADDLRQIADQQLLDQLAAEEEESDPLALDQDRIKGYSVQSSSIVTGQGGDSVDVHEFESSSLDTGDGNDGIQIHSQSATTVNSGLGDDSLIIHSIEQNSEVDTGDGDDTLQNYELIDSKVLLGGGDDLLNTYDIIGSVVGTDDRDFDAPTGPEGDDEIEATNIQNSVIGMGGGNDTLRSFKMVNSVLDTGLHTDERDPQDPVGPAEESGHGHGSDQDEVSIFLVGNSTISTGDDDDEINLGLAKGVLVDGGNDQDELNLGQGQGLDQQHIETSGGMNPELASLVTLKELIPDGASEVVFDSLLMPAGQGPIGPNTKVYQYQRNNELYDFERHDWNWRSVDRVI